jgi:hypothetical protein
LIILKKMLQDRYIHTEKDKEEDLLSIKAFTKAFEEKFNHRFNLTVYNIGELDGIEDYVHCVYDDVIKGAETIYCIRSNDCREMIWLESRINPYGVKDNLIARAFIIQYHKTVKDRIINRFYDFSVEPFGDVLNKFEIYLKSLEKERMEEEKFRKYRENIIP